jgi:hypothetical protein
MTSDSSLTNQLCGTCNKILEQLRHEQLWTQLVHHNTLETLTESARSACGICSLLLEHLASITYQHDTRLWAEMFPILLDSDTSSASWQSSFDLVLTSQSVESLALKFTFRVVEESTGWFTFEFH